MPTRTTTTPRGDALENNVTIYHTIGRRTKKRARMTAAESVAHVAGGVQTNHFTVSLNGQNALEWTMMFMTRMPGVWTKADSVTDSTTYLWREVTVPLRGIECFVPDWLQ